MTNDRRKRIARHKRSNSNSRASKRMFAPRPRHNDRTACMNRSPARCNRRMCSRNSPGSPAPISSRMTAPKNRSTGDAMPFTRPVKTPSPRAPTSAHATSSTCSLNGARLRARNFAMVALALRSRTPAHEARHRARCFWNSSRCLRACRTRGTDCSIFMMVHICERGCLPQSAAIKKHVGQAPKAGTNRPEETPSNVDADTGEHAFDVGSGERTRPTHQPRRSNGGTHEGFGRHPQTGQHLAQNSVDEKRAMGSSEARRSLLAKLHTEPRGPTHHRHARGFERDEEPHPREGKRRSTVYWGNSKHDARLRGNGGHMDLGTHSQCISKGFGTAMHQHVSDPVRIR